MKTGFWLTTSLVLTVAFTSGCGQSGSAPGQAKKKSDAHNQKEHTASTETGVGDDSGWWCKEHGVPEGECALCNAKVASDFKTKGDWCKEHDRPESQCFICHPEFAEQFAARYEAKFGHKPPAREE